MDTVGSSAATSTALPFRDFPSGRAAANGRIDSPGDRDWYAVTLDAGEVYAVSIGQTSILTSLVVRNANGLTIRQEDGRSGRIAFPLEVAESGVYYFDIRALGGGVGDFSISVAETGGTLTDAGGFRPAGYLQNGGDIDVLAAITDGEGRYVIDVDGPAGIEVRAFRADGTEVELSPGGRRSLGLLEFSSSGFEPIYFAISADAAGRFTAALRPADIAGDARTTATIADNQRLASDIDAARDADAFRFTVVQGATYIATATGLRDLDLSVKTRDGEVVLSDADSGPARDPRLEFVADASGEFLLVVDADSPQTGEYAVTLARDAAGDRSTIERVESGFITSALEYWGDVDYFAFEAFAGQSFAVSSSFTYTRRFSDSPFSIRDASDGVLFNFQPRSQNSQQTNRGESNWVAPVDGTYFVEVSRIAYEGGYGISLVEEAPFTTETRFEIVPEEVYSGRFEFRNDGDAYRFSVTAGQGYTVSSSIRRGDFFLVDADGRDVADTFASRMLLPEIHFVAEYTGEYVVFFSEASLRVFSPSTYTVLIRNEDAGDDFSTGRTLGVGESFAGRLDGAADRDLVAITLEAGVGYRFDLAAREVDPLIDPKLRLLAGPGDLVAQNDNGGRGFDARIEFVAELNGVYFLEIESGSGPRDGEYLLSAVLL